MAVFVKGMISVGCAFVLVVVSLLLKGEPFSSLYAFAGSEGAALISWGILLATMVTFNSYASLTRVWVAPALCAIFALICSYILHLFAIQMPSSAMAVGLYALWGAGLVAFAREPFFVRGGMRIQVPGAVCFTAPLACEAILLTMVWPTADKYNLICLGVGAGVGVLGGSIFCTAKRFFSVRAMEVPSAECSSILPVDNEKPQPPDVGVVFPVGEGPGVSVLDAKLSNGSLKPSGGASTRSKIMVED